MRTVPGVRLLMQGLVMAALLPLAGPLSADNGNDGYRLLELDGYRVKWGDQTLGAGASVTYAFANETMYFDDARNCRDLAPMTRLTGQTLPFETLAKEAAAAFRVWERAADLSFHQVDDIGEADIVLGAQGQPGMRALANVSYGPDEQDGVRTIEKALVCLNPDYQWKVGFGGDQDIYDIRYTLVHEIGHAIGLDHPGPAGQVMGFRYTEAFPGLQPGDLRGARRLYGRAGEKPATGAEEIHLSRRLPPPSPE